MKTRSFSRSFLRWVGKNRERLDESSRSKKRRRSIKPLRQSIELLEDRTLPSTLPPPLITGETNIVTQIGSLTSGVFAGTHSTPSVSVDPTNAQNVVAVFTTNMTSVGAANPLWHFPFDDLTTVVEAAFSTNGGQTWQGFIPNDGLGTVGQFVMNDPTEAPSTTDPDITLEQQDDASVAFDRNSNFYIVWAEHRPDNLAGDIRFAKFTLTGAGPVQQATPKYPNGVLYAWAGTTPNDVDVALNPTIAVDTGLPANVPDPDHPGQFVSFVDPIANPDGSHNTQTDPFSGNVYVAWETNNAHPGGAPTVQTNFNPNTIKVVTSSDGGQDWSTQVFTNNSGLGPNAGPFASNFNVNPANFNERDADPQLSVSQGTISNRPIGTLFNGQAVAQVVGGQLNIVWNNFGATGILPGGMNQIRYNRIQNGGAAQDFLSTNNFQPITDAVTPATGNVDITIPTLNKITVNITDPKFTTLSDLSVTVNIAHQNLSQLQVRLLPDAKLNKPYGITIGPNGNIFVSSFSNNSVAEYDKATGALVGQNAIVPPGLGGLQNPTGLVFGPNGDLFVASTSGNNANTILEYTINGTTATPVGVFASGGGLSDPEDLIFDGAGNLYVSSHNTNQILEYDPNGNFLGAFVTAGSGGLNGPEGLVFGPDGNLYVASKNNSSVLEYFGPGSATPGAFATTFVAPGPNSGNLSSPEGLTFGLDGMLYVTSDATNSVLRYEGPNIPFAVPGTFIEAFVPQIPGGIGQGGLDGPQGIIWGPGPVGVGNDLNLYVVGKNADSVFRYSPIPGDPQPASGQTGTSAVYVSGTPLGLSSPGALFLRGGDFLVASFNNSTVYSFDAFTGAINGTFISQGSGGLSGPTGIAVNSTNGSVYVSSQNNNEILRYDGPTGAFIQTLVGAGQGGLNSPSDIVTDNGGTNIYATSAGPTGGQVMRYTASTGANNGATGQPATSALFIPTTDGTNYILHQVTALAITPAVTNVTVAALFVSDFDPNTDTSRILRFDPTSGAFIDVFASNLTSPLQNVQKMSIDTAHNILYVSTANNKVLRFYLGKIYRETLVPLAGLTVNAGFLSGAAGLVYNPNDGTMLVVSSNNNNIMRYMATPSIDNPTAGNNGAFFTNPGGGGTAIVLMANRTNADGSSNGTGVGQTGANLGVSNVMGNGTATGTIFTDTAARDINDGPQGAKAPFQGSFRPEDPAGFSSLIGLGPNALNGTWTLEVTDERNGTVGVIQNWQLNFTSGMIVGNDIAIAGANPLPVPAPLPGRPDSAGSTVGAVNFTVVGPFPNSGSTPVSPDHGIGPTPVIASDNTLGAFSPYQGRLYLAYAAQGPAGSGADNTDVYMSFSDDGGASWSKVPIRLNDDSASDGFSEGNRPQFQPSLSVDQATGTLVATFYDVRNDAAHARVATYIATSIDGGQTFAPETPLNATKTATDAITGNSVVLEPIPDNQGAGNPGRDTAYGFGNHQGVAILQGHLYSVWAGNQNGAGLSILSAQATIAEGPRVASGGQGPVDGQLTQRTALGGSPTTVVGAGPLPTTDNVPYVGMYLQFTSGANAGQARKIQAYTGATRTFALASPLPFQVLPGDTFAILFSDFAADGTKRPLGFEITFDRPVDPTTFSPADVQVMFRNTTTPAATAPITLQVLSVTAEDDSLNLPSSVVASPAPTNTRFAGATGLSNVDGFFTGDTILFTTGANAGKARQITDYVGATRQFIFTNPWLATPSAGDQFIIENGFGPAQAHGATTFLVRFDPTNALLLGGSYTGTYSYQVGPHISDRVRSFKLVLGPGSSIGVKTSNPNKIVPPQGSGNAAGTSPPLLLDPRDTTADTITVSGVPANQLITNVIVSVNISHTSDSDLIIFLESPDGTLIQLSNRNPKPDNSGSDLGYLNTVFDDSAANSIDSGVDPFTGTFRPDQPLASFIGKPANGGWQLLVDDVANNDTGLLNSWSLNIFTAPGSFQRILGNEMDQNSNAITGESAPALGAPYQPPHPIDGDTFIVPRPLTGVPFQLPYDQNTLPIIAPGPHLVSSFVTGEPTLVDRNGQGFPNVENLVINGTASSFDIVFDRDMDPTTVTPTAILRMMGLTGQITGPFTLTPDVNSGQARLINGNMSTAADPDPAHPRTYKITFPTQRLSGTYTITLAAQPKSVIKTASFVTSAAPTTTSFSANTATAPLSPVDGAYVGLTMTFTSGPNAGQSRVISGYTGATRTFTFSTPWGSAPLTGDPFYILSTGELLDTNENAGLDVLRGTSPGIVPDSVQSNPFPTAVSFAGSSTLNPNNGIYNGLSLSFTSGVLRGLTRTILNYTGASHVFTFTSVWPSAPQIGDTFQIFNNLPVSHAYSGPAVILTPGKTIAIPLNFGPENFTIQGVQLKLNITYPFDPDLEGSLVAPDGTTVVLFTKVGGGPGNNHANFTNTIFDDNASTPIQFGVPPFNSSLAGSFNPQTPLSVLKGKASSGTWLLLIKNDNSGTVTGTHTLNSWSLTFDEAIPGTGLGEQIADQVTGHFRIFTEDPQNVLSHTTWTAVGPSAVAGNLGPVPGGVIAPLPNGTLPQLPNLELHSNAGHISSLAVDHSDPSGNTVYIGASGGGIWKTTNFLTTDPNGPTWIPLTDFGPTFAINIGGLDVFARNNDPNQTIIVAGTGDGHQSTLGANYFSQGMGFLVSTNGGATWTLEDSTTNVDASGNPLPFNSTSRDHAFSKGTGTLTFKVVVDPTHAPSGPNDVIIYAAMSGTSGNTNGGLWFSQDTGKHWRLLSDPTVETGSATDVILAPNTASVSTGNLQRVYVAFAGGAGGGVYMSQSQGTNLKLMTGGIGNALIRDGDFSPATSIPVANPGVNPNGTNAGIALATVALTGNPVQDLIYEGWLYAVVANGDGSIRGLYLTKDAGANWTQVHLPIFIPRPNTAFPSNDETRPDANPLATQGFYDISVAVDPTNPNVAYVGGMLEAPQPSLGGLIRVDTITMEDPHNLTKWDNNNKDTGLLQTGTLGSVTLKPSPPFPPLGVYNQIPDGQGGFIPVQVPSQWVNLISDPFNPFLTNSTILVSDTAQFNNQGYDLAQFLPFDGDGGGDFTGDWHQILSMKDPLTGHARLLMGSDHGVFSVVDPGNGSLFQSIGGVSNIGIPGGTTPVITGSRNGNLQITQFYDGAAQPSVQAGELAALILGSGGLIYGNADDNGFPVSDPHILSNGNLTWQGPLPSAGVTHGSLGDGTGIATDSTGTGTAYSFQWPASGLFSFLAFTNFFVVNPNGTGYIARTGTGGTSLVQANNPGPVPDPQWPAIAAEATNSTVPVIPDVVQSTFAVNPINGDQIVIGSAAGRLFRTDRQGQTWGVIAEPTALDSTIVTSLTFGAPDPANMGQGQGNLDDFIWAGTAGGHVYVTLDGGGNNSKDWVNISGTGTNSIDGSPIMSISTNPIRGSHEAYVVTMKGVFHVTFTVMYPTNGAPVVSAIKWQNLTGNLFSLNSTTGLFTNLANVGLSDTGTTKIAQERRLQYLTSLAVDWRFKVPNATGGGTHPYLYVGGEGGIFRSTNSDNPQTTTWTLFPNVANDGASVDGGFLPDSHVTKLTLSVGNINPTTGIPDQAGGPNLLIATTFGRGDFAIRLPNNSPFNPVPGPRVFSVAPNISGGMMTSVTVTFTSTVDPSSFTPADVSLVGPTGTSIAITGVMDITPTPPPGQPNPHNLYQVNVQQPGPTATGPYTITIGPNIGDFSGNLMDQDQDGPPNGQADDIFTGRFFINTTSSLVPGILGRETSTGGIWVGVSNGSSAFSNSFFGSLSPAANWVNVITGDFNGDGKTDVAARNITTGQWWVGINTGSAFSFSFWGTWSTAVTWVDVNAGDFNGDGKTDITGRVQSSGQWWTNISLGNSFSTTFWATWNPSVTWVDVKVGDFDGDGKTDITGRWLQGGSWWTGISSGTSFNTTQWASWNPAVTWVDVNVGDFDGDGKSDIVGRWLQAGQWYVGRSTGTSFDTTLWDTWNPAVTWVDVRVGDFNGDGKTDIAGRWLQAGVWFVGLSQGTSFNTTAWATWNSSVTWVDVVVGDFNGDGKADIAGRWLQAGQWYTGISQGTGFNTTLWDTWSTALNWTDVQVMKNV
jgi:subtilisin-like proprotein convertase family protein